MLHALFCTGITICHASVCNVSLNIMFFAIFINDLNILLQSEALALINPFLKDMTQSELHAALTGGFASVSGSTLGAYIGLGVRVEFCFENQ